MDWVREREHERVGEDCPSQGKREIRDGVVDEDINVFNGQTFTLYYCICMSGRHSVGAVFLDLHCKPVVCYLSVS